MVSRLNFADLLKGNVNDTYPDPPCRRGIEQVMGDFRDRGMIRASDTFWRIWDLEMDHGRMFDGDWSPFIMEFAEEASIELRPLTLARMVVESGEDILYWGAQMLLDENIEIWFERCPESCQRRLFDIFDQPCRDDHLYGHDTNVEEHAMDDIKDSFREDSMDLIRRMAPANGQRRTCIQAFFEVLAEQEEE